MEEKVLRNYSGQMLNTTLRPDNMKTPFRLFKLSLLEAGFSEGSVLLSSLLCING